MATGEQWTRTHQRTRYVPQRSMQPTTGSEREQAESSTLEYSIGVHHIYCHANRQSASTARTKRHLSVHPGHRQVHIEHPKRHHSNQVLNRTKHKLAKRNQL